MTSTDSKISRAMPADGTASRPADAVEPASRVWLYCGDGEDAPVQLESPLPDLGKKDLLWADVDWKCVGDLSPLWEELEIEDVVDRIDQDADPTLIHQNGVLELAVKALRVGPVRAHDVVLPGRPQLGGDVAQRGTRLGRCVQQAPQQRYPDRGPDGPAFLSLVLDWQISGYFGVIESLQTEIDELDEELLARSPDKNDLLDRLQALRTRVRKLRNTLSSHREVLGLLSHPRSDALIGAEAVEDYKRLEDRLQQAIDTVDTTREMIVGSFDIFMTRTAQTTNDIMKRLTIVSVLLLPAAALAGIMGMNFKVEIFEWPWMFWVTIALMLAVAGVTLVVAKRRRWL